MTTPLEKTLKRELTIDEVAYTLVVSPEGLHLAPKGKRNGVELRWADLVNGEAALAVALNASLGAVGRFPKEKPVAKTATPSVASRSPPAKAIPVPPTPPPAKSVTRKATPPARARPAKTGRKASGARRPKR